MLVTVATWFALCWQFFFSGWFIQEVYEYFTRCVDILILLSKQRLQIELVHNGTGAFCRLLFLLVPFFCSDAQLAASSGDSSCVAWHSNRTIGWTGQALECIIRARGSESRDVRWSGALHHMLSSF